MELFELEREKKLKEVIKFRKIQEKELYMSQTGVAIVDYSKPVVQASPQRDGTLKVISKIEEMDRDIYFIDKEIQIIDESIKRLYEVFRQYNDDDKQIYIEKKLWKWPNAKISVKHNVGFRQIQKIVKKIKDSSH